MVKSFAGLPCRLAVICLSAYLVTTVLLNFLTWLVQRLDWWLAWVENTIQVLAHFLLYTLATYLPTYVFLYLHSSTLHNATLHIQLHYDCTKCAHCALFCTEYLNTYILAISCPYSRAEHIPCQNSWEISGNCEDSFQVKFVFHTVCQVLLFFWHVRCRLHMFFPKEDPYFQQFLEMS